MKTWWLRISRYALSWWPGLGATVGLTLVTVGLEALKPWPLKWIVDGVITHPSHPTNLSWLQALPGGSTSLGLLAWLTLGTIALFLASEVATLAQQYLSTGIGNRATYALATDLFDHLQYLSPGFHQHHRSGDLIRRVTTDSSCIKDLLLNVYQPVVTSLLNLVVMLSVMGRLNLHLSLIAMLITPLLVILIRVLNQPMATSAYAHQQLEADLMAVGEQTLSVLPMIQAFSREVEADQRFRQVSHHTLKAYLQSILTQLQFKVGVTGVTTLGTATMMVLGGLEVAQGRLSLGSLLVFLSYLNALYEPMEALAYLSSGFAGAAASGRRVLEILDQPVGVDSSSHPGYLDPVLVKGEIRLEQVTFGYRPGHPVLQQVNLTIQAGETLALIGPTGAGKSSLISLLPRFHDPWQGRIWLDGQDIRELDLKSLRSQISLVLQDPFLLPLSVWDNITYGCPGASREDVLAAAMAARADGFIRQLAQGYDTVLGEGGATLSGGQRQRLAIARALVKKAPILILDEPTAALDTETERLLLSALASRRRGRTTIIIAHRLSTIRKADRIVVFSRGQIIESGTHGQLVAAGGYYSRLLSLGP